MSNPLLDAALDYLKRGWHVNPLQPREKKPMLTDKNWTATWKNYQNTKPYAAEVNHWWKTWPNANIMMICGAGSGVVILDVDGPAGAEALAGFEDIYGPLPKNTPTVKTTKGFHYYFAHPGVPVATKVRFAPELDSRGDGGYGILPPSVHPSGMVYEWAVGPDTPLAPMPEWLVKMINDSVGGSGGKTSGAKTSRGEKYEAKVNPVEVLAGVAEGGRNDALFKYASRLRAQGIGRTEAEILVFQAGRNCNPPMGEKELDQIVESVWSRYAAGEQKPVKPVADPKVLEGLADRKDDVLKPETLGALAILKQDDVGEYARIKAALKGKVNLNDLERAVNQRIAEDRKLHLVDGQEEPAKLEDILPDMPMQNLVKPHEWNLNQNGIWQQTKQGVICACSVPVILTRRLRNAETGDEKIELSFYRDGRWKPVMAERATVFNANGLVQLGNKGLPVSSVSAKNLIKFLMDLERVNIHQLPLKKSVSHMGWCGSHFLPGAPGEVILDAVEGMNLGGGYEESGTLEGWVNHVKEIRRFPLARLVLSASFAAPLLRVIGHRIFILHLWGNTTGGKSASTFAALSVWGNPEEVVGSFNATKVGLERMAAFYSDLPLGIDEKQIAGDKQGFIESIVYLLGMGKGKTRGTKTGGVQAFANWKTVVLTTGEEPLSSSSSTGGIKTRAIEIFGLPIPDKDAAARVYDWSKDFHGTAGMVWINKIIEALAADSKTFIVDYRAIVEKLSQEHPDNIKSHLSALALIAVADYYSSQWIFGLDQDTAYAEALQLAEDIIGQLETVNDADDSQRAYDYMVSWYGVHQDYFSARGFEISSNKRYGYLDGDVVYIYPTVFEEALQAGGFHPGRTLRDFADQGRIKVTVHPGEGKRRFKVRFREGGVRGEFVALVIPKESATPNAECGTSAARSADG